ncbi:MAG: methylenetetrahydrofolate reductase [NAD(P)H] [Gammaproteobacteria bacterium]|nr:methylenetetrahydrofolate reductase [NAD(P)H] [Gammaproteobacteria bacterium]
MVSLSFEFFPPQTPRGRAALIRTARQLGEYNPAFYSVTYGAGGSTRDRTFAAVSELRGAGIEAVPHLSWGSDSAEQVLDLVAAYQRQGVDRLVVLRGDVPSGVGTTRQVRHAEQLVRLIRDRIHAPLVLEVAAYPEVHPEAPSADADIEYLKRKVDAGADGCITQYFYNPDAYFYFLDRCAAAGIAVPIVPGIMPISNYENLVRFSDKAGAEIPRWIRTRLKDSSSDADALGRFGADVVTALCERLVAGGAPGLHFYTLNRAAPTVAVVTRLLPAAA